MRKKHTTIILISLLALTVLASAVLGDGIPRYARKNPPFNPQDGMGWESLAAGEGAVFEVGDDRISLRKITFSLKRDVDSPVIAVYHMLTIPDFLLEDVVSEEVYEYDQFKYTFFTQNDIESAVYDFKVEKIWFENTSLNPGQITFFKYSQQKGWENIPTEMTGEDDMNYYYTAETTGLNYFAVAMDFDKKVEPKEEAPVEETAPPKDTPVQTPPTSEPGEDAPPFEFPTEEEEHSYTTFIVLIIILAIIVGFFMIRSGPAKTKQHHHQMYEHEKKKSEILGKK